MCRITISFPDEEKVHLNDILEFHEKENWSQSKVFVEAFHIFHKQFKKDKMRIQAQKMRSEYLKNPELNIFAALDGEAFHD